MARSCLLVDAQNIFSITARSASSCCLCRLCDRLTTTRLIMPVDHDFFPQMQQRGLPHSRFQSQEEGSNPAAHRSTSRPFVRRPRSRWRLSSDGARFHPCCRTEKQESDRGAGTHRTALQTKLVSGVGITANILSPRPTCSEEVRHQQPPYSRRGTTHGPATASVADCFGVGACGVRR